MSTTALAPAPQRASNSFTLAFGVLNIPLGVYTGHRRDSGQPQGVPRRRLADPRRAAARSARTRARSSPPTGSSAWPRRSNGAWVVLTDDEIADCTTPKGVGDIVTFVPVKDVGTYLAQDMAQVRPKAVKGKADAAGRRRSRCCSP